MKKRTGLGRGLGALIETSDYDNRREESNELSSFGEIEIAQIVANPYQPRTEFDVEALNELAQSIREIGIIQPLTVRRMSDHEYQLISGERRFRASQLAGLEKVPAYIRDATDNQMLELALVENIQREDLNALEIAISYQRLIDECNLTQEMLSERVGKKRATISNYLRLLKLPSVIQLALRDKVISMGHARALLGVDEANAQIGIFEQITLNDLSVRRVEELVRKINDPDPVVETPVVTSGNTVVGEQNQVNSETQTGILSQPHTEVKAETILPVKPLEKEVVVYQDDEDMDGTEVTEVEHEELPAQFHYASQNLSQRFNTKVEIKRSHSGKGRLVIPFVSDTDFKRIIELLGIRE